MSKKFKPELLQEELKRFNMICEYTFHTSDLSEEDDAEADTEEAPEGDSEGAPDDLDPVDADAAADSIGSELGVDTSDPAAEGGEMPPAPAAAAPPPAAPAPASDEVEVDVTSLVQGSDEAKDAANSAAALTNKVLAQMGNLTSKLANMDAIAAKIENLEKEIVKRNPTPVEKLEMRSLASYPYSQKLTDYWAEKEGPYDVMNQDQPKEYTLTQDEVDSTYSESQIKNSFDAGYEEEDI